MATVTPWEVKGDVDYDKLIKEFGLKPMSKLPSVLQDSYLFRRGIVYAHRDFDRIIEAISKNKPFVVMTGMMPSGRFHFGHKLVAEQLVLYQKLGAKIYFAVADIEAYNSRNDNLEELHKTAIEEYLTNYVALGLDLSKCDFYFQSKRSLDAKKSNAYYALSLQFGRHITFNEFKGVYGEVTPGKMSASLLQAADMYHAQLPEFEGSVPVLVPVGVDQDPHIRLARGVASKMKLHKFIPISSTVNTFLPGLKGGKMSSSDPTSHIALTETAAEAKKKINKYAFSGGQNTLEEHRKLGGDPGVDIPFQMLRYGLETDDSELQKIYDSYKKGDLLSGELKKIVIDKLSAFLETHAKNREKAMPQVEAFVKKVGL
jgi:tryptophanyl-tRNA synthetase